MIDNKLIIPKILTRENFAQFGDVIEVNDKAKHFSINDGFTQRYHDLAEVDVTQENGRTLINIFRSTPLEQPVSIKMMERHPLSSQAFIPIGQQPYLVVVAPKGELDITKIEVFLASSNQGVNYHKGTWHHYCLALHQVSDFIVVDRGGAGDNCDVINLDGSLIIAPS
ncbi:ureidoglycolate lyase [Paraglaciecola sp. MB-3u-78]|jgi:ureidoglycolate lyase|uniref:ureidoglycolate lyase n=1 Tax=Paraglaciecola sp. MB-3u-78 TaxID=2058332 RepID=UPI000C349C14|nr:ureidoglycolate lyase [Paraglaciecola sp. MB-3u-78]PKG99474.1 ureidoglycolate lyase [Paraglaciecola sp. MB-3u-78]